MKQFLSKPFFTFLLLFTNIFFSNPSLQKQKTSHNNSTVSFVYKNVETPEIKRKIAEDDSDIYGKIKYDFYRYSFNSRTFYLVDVFKPHNLDLGCQE